MEHTHTHITEMREIEQNLEFIKAVGVRNHKY